MNSLSKDEGEEEDPPVLVTYDACLTSMSRDDRWYERWERKALLDEIVKLEALLVASGRDRHEANAGLRCRCRLRRAIQKNVTETIHALYHQ